MLTLILTVLLNAGPSKGSIIWRDLPHARCFVASSNAKWLACGHRFGDVRVWNLKTGELLIHWKTDTIANVNAICFSPDDKFLAWVDSAGCARVVEMSRGKLVHQWTESAQSKAEKGVALAFSPDGSHLFLVQNRQLFQWNLRTHRRRALTSLLDDVSNHARLVFDPTGRNLIVPGVNEVTRYDRETEKATLAGPDLKPDQFGSVVFIPEVPFWDCRVVNNGRELLAINETAGLIRCQFPKGKTIEKISFPVNSIQHASLSPDCQSMLFISGDKSSVHLAARVGKKWKTKKLPMKAEVVRFLDQKRFFAIQEKRLRLYDLKTLKEIQPRPKTRWPASRILPSKKSIAPMQIFGQIPRTIAIHKRDNVIRESIALSPDGSQIAVLGHVEDEKQLCICDVQSGRIVRRLENGPYTVVSVRFTSDGRFLFAHNHRRAQVWDVQSGKETLSIGGNFFDVDVSPDGKQLALAMDQQVRVVSMKTGKTLATLKGHDTHVTVTRFTRDGTALMSLSQRVEITKGPNNTARMLTHDTKSWKLKQERSWKENVCASPVDISRDGQFLVDTVFFEESSFLASPRVSLWQKKNGRYVNILPKAKLNLIRFSPDARSVVLVHENGEINRHALPSMKKLGTLAKEEHLKAIVFSQDGKRLAVAIQSGVAQYEVWTYPSAKRLTARKGHHGKVQGVIWKDNQRLISTGADKTMRFWNVQTRKAKVQAIETGTLQELSLSASGRWIAGNSSSSIWLGRVGEDKVERLQKVSTGLVLSESRFIEQDFWYMTLGSLHRIRDGGKTKSVTRFRPGIRVVIPRDLQATTGATFRTLISVVLASEIDVRALQSKTTQLSIPVPEGTYPTIWGSPDGRYLVIQPWSQHCRLVERATGKRILSLAFSYSPEAIAFSRDSRFLIIGGAGLGPRLEVWSLATGNRVASLGGHVGSPSCLALSPNGRWLASGGDDSIITLHDTTNWKAITAKRLKLPAPQLKKRWRLLLSENAAKAHEAIWELVSSSGVVDFLSKRLEPVPLSTVAKVKALIPKLSSEVFLTREKAYQELLKLGDVARSELHQALKSKPTLEMRRRLQKLLKPIEALPMKGEALREVRAIQILELIGNTKAKQILKNLASGAPGVGLTSEAKLALQRLNE